VESGGDGDDGLAARFRCWTVHPGLSGQILYLLVGLVPCASSQDRVDRYDMPVVHGMGKFEQSARSSVRRCQRFSANQAFCY
jgi:hypothetical protein